MPFCSRRTWKTPAGFTTWPTPGCYDGVVLPRFQSSHPDRKTAGVYHYNHPDTAADVGLRGLLLSRLNRVRWPTFIPASTTWPVHANGWAQHTPEEGVAQWWAVAETKCRWATTTEGSPHPEMRRDLGRPSLTDLGTRLAGEM